MNKIATESGAPEHGNTPTLQCSSNDDRAIVRKRKSIDDRKCAEIAAAGAHIVMLNDTEVTKKTQLIRTGLAHVMLLVTPIDTATL